MITEDANFISGFVKQCFDQGMTEDETMILFDAAHTNDELHDPDFYAGFKEACDKHASADGRLNPFSVVDSGVVAGGKGGLIGGTLGLLGGAAALRKGRIGAAGKAFKPSAKKFLGGGTAVGGTLGAIIGSGAQKSKEKLKSFHPAEWAPDYLVPGAGAAEDSSGGSFSPGNAFNAVYGDSGVGSAAAGAAGAAAGVVQPVAMGRQTAKQIESLDTQIESLRGGMSSGEGLSGALSNRRIQSQVEKLEKERNDLMQGMGSIYNNVRRDQTTSGKSIAKRLASIEESLEDKLGRGGDAAQWLEATRGNDLGSLPGRLWNKVVGAEGNASELSYEIERLKAERERLLELQKRVGGML